MNRFNLKSLLVIFLFFLVGCTTGTSDTTSAYRQDRGNGYCHKVLKPLGPGDPARTTQATGNDFIDYYGPCDGPSTSDMIREQKRFEQFRFGRDYMDEG
jgi:hypothetical protein